jgi:hypothetical protein
MAITFVNNKMEEKQTNRMSPLYEKPFPREVVGRKLTRKRTRREANEGKYFEFCTRHTAKDFDNFLGKETQSGQRSQK